MRCVTHHCGSARVGFPRLHSARDKRHAFLDLVPSFAGRFGCGRALSYMACLRCSRRERPRGQIRLRRLADVLYSRLFVHCSGADVPASAQWAARSAQDGVISVAAGAAPEAPSTAGRLLARQSMGPSLRQMSGGRPAIRPCASDLSIDRQGPAAFDRIGRGRDQAARRRDFVLVDDA